MRYIRGSTEVGILHKKQENLELRLVGYTDSDYSGCKGTNRSISGYVFTLFGGVISWKACLQKVVTLSTTEAEYTAAIEAVKEGIWLKGILGELTGKKVDAIVYTDNQSALNLIRNPMYHERTKHIDNKLH